MVAVVLLPLLKAFCVATTCLSPKVIWLEGAALSLCTIVDLRKIKLIKYNVAIHRYLGADWTAVQHYLNENQPSHTTMKAAIYVVTIAAACTH
jgi:hypothetical protein